MRVQMLQDTKTNTFLKQFLDIGDGNVTVHVKTGCIKLLTDFCTIVDLQNALIDHIFPNVCTQFMRAGKKSHFGTKKCGHRQFTSTHTVVSRQLGIIQIDQYSLRCQHSCKLSNRVYELIGFARHATTPSMTESWLSSYFTS